MGRILKRMVGMCDRGRTKYFQYTLTVIYLNTGKVAEWSKALETSKRGSYAEISTSLKGHIYQPVFLAN